MYLDENDEMSMMEGAITSTPKRLTEQKDSMDVEVEKNDKENNSFESGNN